MGFPSRASYEWAKWAAIVGMVINHAFIVLSPEFTDIGVAIGRLCFPVFVFLAALACAMRPDRLEPLFLRLLGWGLLAQVPYALAFGYSVQAAILNALLSLALGVSAVIIHNKAHPVIAMIFLWLLSVVGVQLDGGLWIPVVIYCAWHLLKTERVSHWVVYCLIGVAMMLMNLTFSGFDWLVSAFVWLGPLALLVSTKVSQQAKRVPGFVFYGIYPGHLLLFWGLSQVMSLAS